MVIRRAHLGLCAAQDSKDVLYLHPLSFLDEKTKGQMGQIRVWCPGQDLTHKPSCSSKSLPSSLFPEDPCGPGWGCPPWEAGKGPRRLICDLEHPCLGFPWRYQSLDNIPWSFVLLA